MKNIFKYNFQIICLQTWFRLDSVRQWWLLGGSLYEVHCHNRTKISFGCALALCASVRGVGVRAAITWESYPRVELRLGSYFSRPFSRRCSARYWLGFFKSDAALAAAQKTKYTAEKNVEMEKSRALFVCSLWRQTNTRQELPLKVPERVTTLAPWLCTISRSQNLMHYLCLISACSGPNARSATRSNFSLSLRQPVIITVCQHHERPHLQARVKMLSLRAVSDQIWDWCLLYTQTNFTFDLKITNNIYF